MTTAPTRKRDGLWPESPAGGIRRNQLTYDRRNIDTYLDHGSGGKRNPRQHIFRLPGDLLPAFVLATLPFGALLSGIKGLPVVLTASQILALLLIVRTMLGPDGRTRGPQPWVLWSVLLLGVPLIYAISFESAFLAYFNFAIGVFGGTVVGRFWAACPRPQFSLFDVALFLIPCIASIQLLLSLSATSSVVSLHQNSDVGWGRSNYVAAVIVVSSLAVVARLIEVAAPWFIFIIPVATCLISLLAVSRGGILALGFGTFVLLWAHRSTSSPSVRRRIMAIIFLVVTLLAVNVARDFRAVGSAQVDVNVGLRFELSSLALQLFLDNPLGGTGWTGLRGPSLVYLGQQQSFAHSVIPSFLQIGGLLSIPFLVLLIWRIVCAIRAGGVLLAPVFACIVISLTDPFFEGTIGGTLAWACLTVLTARLSERRRMAEV